MQDRTPETDAERIHRETGGPTPALREAWQDYKAAKQTPRDDDIIMRGISYVPIEGPYTHRRWWRIELAHAELEPLPPSACIQGFTFWLGERAIYG